MRAAGGFAARWARFLVSMKQREIEFQSRSSMNQTGSRGGKRLGAGRKPSTIKGISKRLPRESAELILAEIKANSMWLRLADSKDERIRLETLKYLTDRAFGKARQSIEATAERNVGLVLIHSVPMPERD